ncbi:MAG TPA: MFS transporter [Streptosporangiaceae bacterium]|nr:MFS transporter [Streptosporangiaceae bacterium]
MFDLVRGGELRAVLHSGDFRRLYATRLISQLSDGVFQVALAGYVFFSPAQQTSPAKAAVAFAVLLLPYSIVGPFAGVFIDRWSRQRILVWSPLVRAVLVGAVAASLTRIAALYGAALLVLGVNRFFLSALSAALPHVVARRELVTANALAVTSGTIIAFAGAGVGYLLRQIFGPDQDGTATILVCSAAAYLGASALAMTMGRDRLGPERPDPIRLSEALGEVVRGLADGARYIWRQRRTARALAAISAHRFLYGIVLIMAGLLYRNYFTTNPQAGLAGLAFFLLVSGAGFFAGAVATPWAVRKIGKDIWISLLLGLGALTVATTLTPFRQFSFLIGGFLLGVVSQGVKVSVDTIVQESVDDAYRGRVFSVYDMLFNATFVGAAAVAAIALPTDGKSYGVLAFLTAAYILTALAYSARSSSRTGSSSAARPSW